MCVKFIGKDGLCKEVTTDQLETDKCALNTNTCKDAPTTLKTDEACLAYHPICKKTTGMGCIETLGDCTSYTDLTSCDSLIGSDGKCTKDSDAQVTTCIARTCANATGTTTTDEGCAAYLTGCVTNNVKCVDSLEMCKMNTGSETVACEKYKGTDGPCKSSETATGSCLPKVCTDNTTSTTEAECVA